MGVNIGISNKEATAWDDLHEWDSCRWAGDKQVGDILFDMDYTANPNEDEQIRGVRPNDVDGFEKRLLEKIDCNHDRWKQMCALLRKPDMWLYFSW